MGTTLMKINPVKFSSDMTNSLKRAKDAGRELSETFLKMIEEYQVHAAQAESFKKKYEITSSGQMRDAAIKFVLGHPDVHTVSPTINSFEDLAAYVSLSGAKLKQHDKAMLADYKSVYGRFYCRHACGKCESSCPQSVPVNTIMRYQHYFAAQGREKQAMGKYLALPGNNASGCSSCSGLCQSACPYNVPIQGLLIDAHDTLWLS